MDMLDTIRDAGIVGAGGAGFPAHVKLRCSADTFIANGAECEPLLRVDQELMAAFAHEVVDGMRTALEITGAKRGVVALKEHYHDAVRALRAAAGGMGIELHLMRGYYPAGDEKSLIQEVTGRLVPTGKLPIDMGVVVNNVNTLINISRAKKGQPVTDRYVTVCGAVENPVTLLAPVGAPMSALLRRACAPDDLDGFALILGGPMMGKVSFDFEAPVTKTLGGAILLPKEHPLIVKRTRGFGREARMAKAACCQCSYCTQLCPRNALGFDVTPHKAMRAIGYANGALIGNPNSVLACCGCSLCTDFACNFGLNPAGVMARLKDNFAAAGIKPVAEERIEPSDFLEMKKVSVKRLIAKLGLSQYDADAPLQAEPVNVSAVRVPLSMHIGKAAQPIVKVGDHVTKGQLIADIPEGALGARIHAGIGGEVFQVGGDFIEIRA